MEKTKFYLIKSASSGGTLAGRRFLRSVAYLCAKQIIDLPILLTNNDHYDSPSTGLRKATSSRLLRFVYSNQKFFFFA